MLHLVVRGFFGDVFEVQCEELWILLQSIKSVGLSGWWDGHRHGSNTWRRLPVPGLNGSGGTAVRSLWADLCQWELLRPGV